VVGEVIFREDQNLTELIGGLQGYSKELVPLSQPKTPTAEGFLVGFPARHDWRFT